MKRTCKAHNKRGERCGARAVERGLCAAHASLVDMQAIGRKGGSRSPLTKLRKEADDGLREQAREVLSRALAGEAVDKAQLDAARSLFAFRPSEAPRGREGPELQHPGRCVFSIQQLVEQATEVQLFSQSGWLDRGAEAEMLEKVKASRARAMAADE
jgi:hypothetical protein